MLLDCPACARSYHVSRAEIGEGREVICPRCEARWHVDADGNETAATDLETFAVSVRPEPPLQDNLIGAARPRPSLRRRLMPLTATAACLLLAMGLLGGRERVVRLEPRLAGLYARIGLPVNLRGLDFAAVTTTRGEGAAPDLTIAGEIRNVAQRRVGVPRLRYEVRDAAGAPLASWTETAPAKTLAVGKRLAFVSSPHSVPADARSILVRFETDEAPAPAFRLARRTP